MRAAKFLIILFLSVVLHQPSSAQAQDLRVDLSERLIPVSGSSVPDEISVIVSGKPNEFYQLGWSPERTIFSVTEAGFVIGAKTSLIQVGQLDGAGHAKVQFRWPANGNGSIYVGAATSLKSQFERRVEISPSKLISNLPELVQQFGITGPVGPQGPQGPQGVQGPAGAMGPVGATGPMGPQGEIGPMGPQGVQGETGPLGPQGIAGPMGERGEKGDKGDKGDTGEPPPVIMWSGGCGVANKSAGWLRYCLDSTDFNTSTDYLNISVDGTVNFLKGGFYRVNFWSLHAMSELSYLQVYRNGKSIHQAWIGSQGWIDSRADVTWLFSPGDTLTIDIYNGTGGGYAYDRWMPEGALSRLQVSYMGKAP